MTDLFWRTIQPLRYLIQNTHNVVWLRFDYNEPIDQMAFWCELNIGWREMEAAHRGCVWLRVDYPAGAEKDCNFFWIENADECYT
jgi:hypothetical protein